MPEWPIYQCSSCNAILEEDDPSLFYQVFGFALILSVTQVVGGILFFWIFQGDELASDVGAWVATAIGLYWFYTRPKPLGERGAYAKQRDSSNK